MKSPSIEFLELCERIARQAADFVSRHNFHPSHVLVGHEERSTLFLGREENTPWLRSLPNNAESAENPDTIFGLIIEEGPAQGITVIRKNCPETALQHHQRMSLEPVEPRQIRYTEHVHTCPKCKRPFKFIIHESGYIEQVIRCTCGAAMPPVVIA